MAKVELSTTEASIIAQALRERLARKQKAGLAKPGDNNPIERLLKRMHTEATKLTPKEAKWQKDYQAKMLPEIKAMCKQIERNR